MRNLLIAIIFCVSSMELSATEYFGKVKGFYVDNSNTVLVKLKNGSIRPDCTASNGWEFQFNSESSYAKSWISMILAARMADKEIRVGYTPNNSGSCAVSYFYFY